MPLRWIRPGRVPALIVENCIILGRAEMFACKNNVVDSALDGLGMGLGFTLALTLMATVREILGSGTWLGIQIIPKSIPNFTPDDQRARRFLHLRLPDGSGGVVRDQNQQQDRPQGRLLC